MPLELDDEDTIPTENASVLRHLAAELAAALPLALVAWGAATSPGVRRRINEDAWGRRDKLFVVADGMGGRGGGALAARTAVDSVLGRVPRSANPGWRRIVEAVNADVRRAGDQHGVERLGTTLLAASIGDSLVTIVHVGDSRAYRATHEPEDRLDLLTRDHTVRAELLAAGLDIGDYRERGVALHGLTSFIGLEGEILRVDVLAVSVRAGDRVLLCTDGVYHQLDDDQIRAALRASTARLAAEELVAAADDAGGRDNATAIVLEVGARGPAGGSGGPR